MNPKNVIGVTFVTAVLVVSGCSDTKEAAKPTIDFAKVEKQVKDQLDKDYARDKLVFESVSCDKSNPSPDVGATFMCNGKVREAVVPVTATVKDADFNLDLKHTVEVVDLDAASARVTETLTSPYAGRGTGDCGTGLKAVEPGTKITCKATMESGAKATATYSQTRTGSSVDVSFG